MDADTEEKITETSQTSKDDSEKPVIENKSRSALLNQDFFTFLSISKWGSC